MGTKIGRICIYPSAFILDPVSAYRPFVNETLNSLRQRRKNREIFTLSIRLARFLTFF